MVRRRKKSKGWTGEPVRHSLASKGVRTTTLKTKTKIVGKPFKRQTGSRKDLKADRKLQALPPSRRISEAGNPYTETRKNRSDLKHDSIPKRRRKSSKK